MLQLLLLCVLLSVSCARGSGRGFPDCLHGPLSKTPICDTAKPPKLRAQALVKLFTDAELIANTVNESPGVPRLGLPAYQWWSEALHGVAGSPGVSFTSTGNFSSATSFPSPILLGSTFDDPLVKATAVVTSMEARAFNNAGRAGLDFFTPNINPFKDPRWGRGQETPGEDAVHGGRYVLGIVEGLQGQGDGEESQPWLRVAADCKHFAAYDMENWIAGGVDRSNFDARVTMQDLSEYYLRPFQSCVRDAKVASVMCSFNSLNGVPACASGYLLDTVLREYWGFDEGNGGWVTADCDAVDDIFRTHHFTGDYVAAVVDALKAGTDLDCGTTYATYLPQALNQSLITRGDLEKSLVRQYTSLVRLGYFDPPEIQPYRQLTWDDVNLPASQKLAYQAAVEGIVLLKNDGGLLPLKQPQAQQEGTKITKMAMIGPWANATTQMQGNYNGAAPFLVSPLMGAVEAGFEVKYARGTPIVADALADGEVGEAMEAVRWADIVVFAGGIDGTVENEALDRVDIAWPENQLELVRRITKETRGKKPLIVLQFGGGQLDDEELNQSTAVDAILWAGYPGQSGGKAIFDIVTGKVSPSGRLSTTQYPAAYTTQVNMTDMNLRPNKSTGNPGRTYKWYTGVPVYEFGHGLHYTRFSLQWGDLLDLDDSGPFTGSAPSKRYDIKKLISSAPRGVPLDLAPFDTFDVRVKNTGRVESDYIALLFVNSTSAGPAPRPNKQLVSYTRIHRIPPAGSSKDAKLPVTLGAIARADKEGNMWIYNGVYEMCVDTGPVLLSRMIELVGEDVQITEWPQDEGKSVVG